MNERDVDVDFDSSAVHMHVRAYAIGEKGRRMKEDKRTCDFLSLEWWGFRSTSNYSTYILLVS